MLPGYALSMRRKETSRPEGSTIAMFWDTLRLVARKVAACITDCASAWDIVWRCRARFVRGSRGSRWTAVAY